jgi:hypothetical protein
MKLREARGASLVQSSTSMSPLVVCKTTLALEIKKKQSVDE